MRLDDEYRKSVVLIGTQTGKAEDSISAWGTGFLVGTTDEPTPMYLVTAWHVVAENIDAPFDVRFNKADGGARCHRIDRPNWITHESDNTVDVAVHEIEVPKWADYRFIPKYPNILLDDRRKLKNIGAGNRTYTVGLWKFLRSDQRNQPFVYTGHVGLIPEGEKIPVKPWLKEHGSGRVQVDAYLVEGEPLDGASGSPVFVRRTIPIKVKLKGAKKPVNAAIEGSVWLLGLQSDAFVGEPGKDYEIPTGGGQILVPRGVNVVVPSTKIAAVLDHPKLIAARKKIADANMPIKTGEEPPTKAGNPRHREDFSRLLGAAVSRSKPKPRKA